MISACFLHKKKNDLQVRKIISFQFRNDFLHKKMISKELKNDFREMIFGTFCAGFEDVIYSWEKNHFLRKWAFPEMNGNHFFPENARHPPKSLTFKCSINDVGNMIFI